MLLQTRKLILGTYFEVESAGRMSEAGSMLSRHSFDVIVLCDTLSNDERRQIAEMVRDRRPRPTLLSLLGPGNQGVRPTVGRELSCCGPLELLRECADVLRFDLHTGNKRLYVA